ncbi:hypothetical protein SPWS13_2956 [Shewanella putrefaciens]|nr:hypothetical protein SPWS13_2956 [Shewanella putrefaciens]
MLAWDTLNDSTESEHKLIDSNERTMEQFNEIATSTLSLN